MFIGRKGMHTVQPVVAEMIAAEEATGMLTAERMHRFARDVWEHRLQLVRMLTALKDKGKTLAGIGAPAKGSTLLNYCGINPYILSFVTEKNTLKVGRYTPGSRIPILPDSALLERRPDYALILPWNFSAEIMKNLKAYKDAGGTFIVPIPTPVLL